MPQLLDPGLSSVINTASGIGAGWKLNFYTTGTSTRKDTFPTSADASAGTNANANPVVLSSDGRVPPIWFLDDAAYKCVLTDENDVVKETIDPINDSALAALLGLAVDQPYNVMTAIPASLYASIRNLSLTTSVISYMNTAASAAVAAGRSLYFPAGAFPFLNWLPPANLRVLTAGKGTIFRQLDTSGVGTRMIDVQVDGVELWPGGSATIDGQIDTIPNNATQFNSGVRVHAPAGVTINTFICGDIYGQDLGGDVFETGAAATGSLTSVTVGTLYGNNIYRNIISVTAGLFGKIGGVIQTGGVGFLGFDWEPDPASGSAPKNWVVTGPVRVKRGSVVGDAAVITGSVHFAGGFDMDYTLSDSSPVFDEGGVSAVLTPDRFETGFVYRNAKAITAPSARISGFPRAAIDDIGSAGGDTPTERVHFGALELSSNGATTGYEIDLQKTYQFEVGFLRRSFPGAATVGVFRSNNAINRIEVHGGQTSGRMVYSAAGDFEASDVAIAGTVSGTPRDIFTDSTGRIDLSRVVVTSAGDVFDNCTGTIVAHDCSLAGTNIFAGTTAQARYLRSTVNGVFYDDQLASAANAQTGTSYTLVAADLGKLITCTNAGAITLTVPANATVAFPITGGKPVCRVMQGGAGAVTVAAAGGVTLRSRGGLLNTNGQYAAIQLTKIGTDEWLVDGDRA